MTTTSNSFNSPSRPIHRAASHKLDEIYREMRHLQVSAIRKAGMRTDPNFLPDNKIFYTSTTSAADSSESNAQSSSLTVDKRRCLAVSAIMDNSNHAQCSWTNEYHVLQKRLKEEFGDYGLIFQEEPPELGGGQLHWTLMQLIGFADYGEHITTSLDNSSSEPPSSIYLSSEYLDCVQDSLTVGGLDAAMHFHYFGVIAVATGLLMIGLPSVDINETRDIVRSRLKQQNMPLLEPFVNDIVHSTLFRVAGDPSEIPHDLHIKILKLADEFKDVFLGTETLSKFQIGPASSRLLKNEIDDTPPIREWRLPSESSIRNYNVSIMNEEETSGRTCYTVSGALGFNLAKEVRNLLYRQDLKNDPIDVATMHSIISSISQEGDGSSFTRELEFAFIPQESGGLESMPNDIDQVRERIEDLFHVLLMHTLWIVIHH